MLVLRALGLGDLLTAVPALRALRAGLPGHEVVLGAPAALTPLVRLADAADRLLPVPGLAEVPWEGPPPRLAVNLHGSGPQSHRRLLELRPGRLVAYRNTGAGVGGPAWDADEHEVSRWCRLVEESLGLPADREDLGLAVPDRPAGVSGAVVVHPGAAYPARRWPADRFAAVARWASDRGLPVLLTGGSAERDLAEEVRRAAGLPPDSVLAGRTDLEDLAAVVAGARLVVSGDTGLAHLATAYGTPSVVLFGPVSPARWGPPATGPHVALWHGRGDGDPWGEQVDPALAAIGVPEVVSAAERLLEQRSPGRTATSPASA